MSNKRYMLAVFALLGAVGLAWILALSDFESNCSISVDPEVQEIVE